MGKRARRGGRSELARDLRAEARDSHTQAGRPGRAVPTQGPEPRRELARPSLAPGYLTSAAAAAAADAEFPEDWPRAESPEAVDTAASPEVNADIAAARWRCAAGPAFESEVEQAPQGRLAESAPVAVAAACSESESSIESEPADYLWVLEESERRARRKGNVEDAAEFARLAALERAHRIAVGEPLEPDSPAADYEVSLGSEGLSTGGVGSNPNSPRSPIAPPASIPRRFRASRDLFRRVQQSRWRRR